ncbi:hypothetical protein [Rhodoferax sp.]|uniref:hypothetical protein n=1 Tax=Rhodoferax sp. TaxID=50421 RepID=UPI00276E2796|nr:hypothetical protein [Rhodoferax sp.]
MSGRSRYKDYDPSGANVELRESDIAIFELLQEFPYLSLPYIGELLGAKPQTVTVNGKQVVRYEYLRKKLMRLRKDGGYLRCPADSWKAANSRWRPAVYALTAKGKAVLREQGLFPSFKLGNDFAHDFGSCVVPASFKIGVMTNPSLRFIQPREIIEHRACPESTRISPEPFTIPVRFTFQGRTIETNKEHDWSPWGIGYRLDDGRERKIFFPGHEFDRSTEPLETDDLGRSSVTRHLLSILSLLDGGYKRHFGLPSVYIPIVTVGERRLKSIMRQLLKLTDGKGSQKILFKHIPDFASYGSLPAATGHMLTEPWERAGHESFDILKEIGATV